MVEHDEVSQQGDSIDVIVPVYNKRPYLDASISSILAAAEAAPGVSVTVVDHGSTDGSLECAVSLCSGRARHLVKLGGTIGAVRNAGARLSDGAIVSFLDSDCVVPLGYFDSLRRVLELHQVAATGCRVDYPDDGPWVERVWHQIHRAKQEDGPRVYLNSGNLAIRRSAFEAIGGFSESLVSGEDTDIGRRLNERGLRVWESRELRVLHVDNPRTIPAFFRKEVWHALGLYSMVRAWPPSRPLLMTMVHVAALVVAFLWAYAGSAPLGLRVSGAVVMVFVVPIMTVLYRSFAMRRLVPLLPAVLLYQVYFLARIVAPIVLVLRRFEPSKGAEADVLFGRD
jgi:GT2 family glycosyltransferase